MDTSILISNSKRNMKRLTLFFLVKITAVELITTAERLAHVSFICVVIGELFVSSGSRACTSPEGPKM